LLWLVFLLFSLFAIRNIIYFAMVAIITIFYNANERFSYDKNFSNERIKNKNYYFITRYSAIFVFSFCMIKNAMINIDCRYYDFEKYGFRSCMWGVSLRDFPNKAVDFIIKEKLPKRLFNDFNSGSYLVGRAFPARKVFIDGRTEFYGNSFLKDYRAVTKGDKEKIQEIITKYRLEGFLLSISASNFDKELASYLLNQPTWKVVYFDDKAMIFLKYDKNNKNLIKKFGINLKEWSAPKIKLERIGPRAVYPYNYIMRGKALKELGCFQAAISEAKEALKIMPNSIEALETLGDCYFGLKKYKPALENYRLALTLNPGDAGLRNNFALSLYRLGYLSESETQLLKIIKQRPKDAQNYYALALVYKKQNKLQQAQKMIKTACLYSKNENFGYLKLRADILLELKDYQEALKIYKFAQQLNTEDNQIKETIENIEKTL
ncbi:MAG: tetratricopeptide repeat protein, partial [Candidatus Omnitrophica bacterium]|nr:tetratricopeptide repeat protein [Candidatus Omnitrophota bacterium]